MSDNTERLDAIRAKWQPPLYAEPLGTPADVAFLLDLARKQEARFEAARSVHEPIEALMYSGSQQRLVKVCTGCGTDDGNWQRWPCPTIKALEAKP